ncbi:hypothetical protein ACFL6U_13115 [Planctomycetota bacterium]
MKNYSRFIIGGISVIMMTVGSVAGSEAENYPQAEISNGLITAKIWTPDPEKGFYRGTRFDWSGAIASLRYQGHEFFGPWRDNMVDPEVHDNITGPVESFMANNAVLGYKEAKVGETFMRIGVGLCEKPQEKGYTWTHTYEVVEPGKWTIKQDKNWIEFTHELADGKGYAYRYTKRLTLPEGKPELVLSHVLENTGEKTIATEAFNHNFFVIDGRPSGPEFEIEFPFAMTATRDLKGLIAIRGNKIHYPKELQEGDAIYTVLEGYGTQQADNAFRIENKKTGVAVSMKTDQPLHKLCFWTIRRTLCPEPYIFMKINSGETQMWDTQYVFFEKK